MSGEFFKCTAKYLWIVFLVAGALQIGCNQASKAPATPGSKTPMPAQSGLDKIKLPPDYTISIYAEVAGARSMCFGTNGELFVGTMAGKVYAVVDKDHNGYADNVYVLASGLNSPNGVAFRDGNLYVAEISRILRFDAIQ